MTPMGDDISIACAECGTRFVWTSAEQAAAGPRPVHCPMCRRLAPGEGRRRGLVKWFNRGKGYGFITPADGPEVFIHKSALAGDRAYLQPGQLVEFRLEKGARGVQAGEVVVLDEPSP